MRLPGANPEPSASRRRRLADSHLASPTSMHTVGPPPFLRYHERYVTSEVAGKRVTCGRHYTRLMAQTWDDALRAGGYRVTPQRQLVLEAVARLEHATPEEIYGDVRQTARGVNVSTVYRTLELLEQLGLVKHSHLHHGAPTYHLAEHDARHVHLICRQCERVTEVDRAIVQPLVAALEENQGFLTDVGHLTVFGLCADCRS
jgi:Fur family ferric uptake transcriptional regulator